ncbi:MAG: hypothetical protein IJQ55_03170, partial [Alphaproteobacteria bacterium]|nr:hypothetical protein [Alphaproteobacteria bacterium]
MYYISIRQGEKFPLTRRKTSVGAQSFQTPSYILSPLDFGPKTQFRMPISFSPFLPFKASGKYRWQQRYFFVEFPISA